MFALVSAGQFDIVGESEPEERREPGKRRDESGEISVTPEFSLINHADAKLLHMPMPRAA